MKNGNPDEQTPDGRLKDYQAKRRFDKTPEPTGSQPAPADRPGEALIFCVQKHLASHLHYDFRLELGGVLLSWAVPKGPSVNPKDKRLAIMTEDHPLDYAGFEGVIPEGYGAGIVMLWDSGTWLADAKYPDVAKAIKNGEITFRLAGQKLKGTWTLVRTGNQSGRKSRAIAESSSVFRRSEDKAGKDDEADDAVASSMQSDAAGRRHSQHETEKTFGNHSCWLMMKRTDEWARAEDITQTASLSVKTGVGLAEILAKAKPDVWDLYRSGKSAAGELAGQIIQQAAAIRCNS
jgi:bifunctional non-homologous end joining protein LigD